MRNFGSSCSDSPSSSSGQSSVVYDLSQSSQHVGIDMGAESSSSGQSTSVLYELSQSQSQHVLHIDMDAELEVGSSDDETRTPPLPSRHTPAPTSFALSAPKSHPLTQTLSDDFVGAFGPVNTTESEDEDYQLDSEEEGFQQFATLNSRPTTPDASITSTASSQTVLPHHDCRVYTSDSDRTTLGPSPRNSNDDETRSDLMNTPLRRLLEKTPRTRKRKPMAAVTPVRQRSIVPFKRCLSSTFKIKRSSSELKKESFGEKKVAQVALHKYFKLKKKLKHCKKEVARKPQSLNFNTDENSDGQVNFEAFRNNFSQILSNSLTCPLFPQPLSGDSQFNINSVKTHTSNFVQNYAKSGKKPCGCLCFCEQDDNVEASEERTQTPTTQSTNNSQRMSQSQSQFSSSQSLFYNSLFPDYYINTPK